MRQMVSRFLSDFDETMNAMPGPMPAALFEYAATRYLV